MEDLSDFVERVVELFTVTPLSRRHAIKAMKALAERYDLTVDGFTALQSYECASLLHSLVRFGFLPPDGRRRWLKVKAIVPEIGEESLRALSTQAWLIYERFEGRDVDQFCRSTATLVSAALLGDGEIVIRATSSADRLLPRAVQLN